VPKREYPELPLVGVGGVVISGERVLLARRGAEPLRGEWSIPGGLLEVGETLEQGVARELLEETGIHVRVLELVEALERIFFENAVESATESAIENAPGRDRGPEGRDPGLGDRTGGLGARPKYHYVILDYLCEAVSGEPRAGGDVTEVAFAREDELAGYHLAPKTEEVIAKAFLMARARR
jgi:8-oxo-dGTP diphosphatase